MLHYEDNLLARGANSVLAPLAGVLVTVTSDATGQPAALYSDNGVTPLAQPLTTDNDGHFGFYVGDGKYTLTFTSPRITTFTRSIALDDPNDNPVPTLAQLAAPTGANSIGYTRSSDGSVLTVAAALDSIATTTAAAVRTTVLTGLDLTVNAAITAADTVLAAFGKLQKQLTAWMAQKDASGGYVGKTGHSHNFWNIAGTFMSAFQNAATAARTYAFPDKSGTVAMISDIPTALGSTILLGQATVSSAVSQVDFLNIFTSSYDTYVIELTAIIPTAASPLALLFANGGAPDSGTHYTGVSPDGSPTINTVAQANLSNSVSVLSTNGANLSLRVLNANGSGYKTALINGSFMPSANPTVFMRGCVYTGPAVSGFRVYFTTSTIASGTIRVYGCSNS